ncbi:MAG: peptide deformylase [Alphaproteobacteria bacterium]|nr:peptide deformylase [Alphaproteobacteria bacterium]
MSALSIMEKISLELQSDIPPPLPFTSTDDPILRKRAEPIEDPTSLQTKTIALQLFESIKAAGGGFGLAAPQVGISKRLFICSFDWKIETIIPIINPAYKPVDDEMEAHWEACFSVPNTYGNVMRYKRIRCSYQTIDGKEINTELEGIQARVFQHEYDHLDGVLYPDKCIDLRVFDEPNELQAFRLWVRKEREKAGYL